MDQIQNPIQHLYDMLKVGLERSDGASTLDVWAGIFECEPSNTFEVVRGLSSVFSLIDESKKAAEFIPGDKTRFIVPLERVEQMMRTQNLSRVWAESKAYLDVRTMTALDFGAYAMTQFFPGASQENSEKILEFVEKLDALMEECLTSELSAEIKALFVKHLQSLRAALMDYRIKGVAGLEIAMDSIVGSIHRNAESIKAQPEESKAFIQEFFDVLGKVNDLVSGYETAAQLAAPVVTTLLLPIIHAAS